MKNINKTKGGRELS